MKYRKLFEIIVIISIIIAFISISYLENDEQKTEISESTRYSIETHQSNSFYEIDPILIVNDDQFLNYRSIYGWPGNGSNENPYIISGYTIRNTSGSAININNVELYFVITNCLLSGASEFGMELKWVKNAQIINNTIKNNGHTGILLRSSSEIAIINNTIENNYNAGMNIQYSSNNNTIANNTISNNQEGIALFVNSFNNTIVNNTFNNNHHGIQLTESPNNTIIANRMMGEGLFIYGNLQECLQKEVIDNFVNGKPLICWQNENNKMVPLGAGQIVLINTSKITISNQNLSDVNIGLLVIYSNQLNISSNTFDNNNDDGIGIRLYRSSFITISNNTISNWGWYGISTHKPYSYNITISNNIIYQNGNGIELDGYNHTVTNNLIAYSNYRGVYVASQSPNNTINFNNFIGNNQESYERQVFEIGGFLGENNNFSSNYWDDWTSPDNNNDGIVDIPYPIECGNDQGSVDPTPVTTPLIIGVHFITKYEIIYPKGGDLLDGSVSIQWTSVFDLLGHQVVYDVYYSDDGGNSWSSLVTDFIGTSYVWDTTTVPDGSSYKLKINASCTEGLYRVVMSDVFFEILNHEATTSTTTTTTKMTTTEPSPEITSGFAFITAIMIICGIFILKRLSYRI